MERTFSLFGAILMFSGVGLGAFGAHGLASYFERFPELTGTFDTAVRYHLLHGLALFVAAWANARWPSALTGWAGYLLFVGTLLFSGSLYMLVFTRLRFFGAVTPFGGFAFLGGWLLLALAAWRG